MKRILTYRAEASESLNLRDLRRIVDEAEKLGVYGSTRPTVRVLHPTKRDASAVGTIREITIESDAR